MFPEMRPYVQRGHRGARGAHVRGQLQSFRPHQRGRSLSRARYEPYGAARSWSNEYPVSGARGRSQTRGSFRGQGSVRGQVRGRGVAFQQPDHDRSGHCRICDQTFGNIRHHIDRKHTLKFIGYECPLCGFFEGRYDKGLFVRHVGEHPNPPDVEACIVEIPEVYAEPALCEKCFYKGRNSMVVARHAENLHPLKIESYRTASAVASVASASTTVTSRPVTSTKPLWSFPPDLSSVCPTVYTTPMYVPKPKMASTNVTAAYSASAMMANMANQAATCSKPIVAKAEDTFSLDDLTPTLPLPSVSSVSLPRSLLTPPTPVTSISPRPILPAPLIVSTTPVLPPPVVVSTVTGSHLSLPDLVDASGKPLFPVIPSSSPPVQVPVSSKPSTILSPLAQIMKDAEDDFTRDLLVSSAQPAYESVSSTTIFTARRPDLVIKKLEP